MKTYSINDLYAGAWQTAIAAVAAVLGLSADNDWRTVEDIAQRLNIRFDINGVIAQPDPVH